MRSAIWSWARFALAWMAGTTAFGIVVGKAIARHTKVREFTESDDDAVR